MKLTDARDLLRSDLAALERQIAELERAPLFQKLERATLALAALRTVLGGLIQRVIELEQQQRRQ